MGTQENQKHENDLKKPIKPPRKKSNRPGNDSRNSSPNITKIRLDRNWSSPNHKSYKPCKPPHKTSSKLKKSYTTPTALQPSSTPVSLLTPVSSLISISTSTTTSLITSDSCKNNNDKEQNLSLDLLIGWFSQNSSKSDKQISKTIEGKEISFEDVCMRIMKHTNDKQCLKVMDENKKIKLTEAVFQAMKTKA